LINTLENLIALILHRLQKNMMTKRKLPSLKYQRLKLGEV